MEQEIRKVIEKFELDISRILGSNVIDVIIHGSTVTGGFIKGKGDIDFIVFTKGKITEVQKEQLFNYHRNIRSNKTLESQLEGCYYSLDEERNEVIGGIYLGTKERGWKEVNKIVHSKLGMADVLCNYFSTHESGVLDKVFNFTWKEVESELKEQSLNLLSLLNEYDDYEFKVYAIYVSARSLYTMENKGFISKGESLKWILEKVEYKNYQELINECAKLRNPLSIEEIQEINKVKFINMREFLFQVDKDIQSKIIEE